MTNGEECKNPLEDLRDFKARVREFSKEIITKTKETAFFGAIRVKIVRSRCCHINTYEINVKPIDLYLILYPYFFNFIIY